MSTYREFSDHELLCLLRAQDETAFNEIYNRYWAAYTGQTISLADALASNEVFFPEKVSWDMKYDRPIAIPGK